MDPVQVTKMNKCEFCGKPITFDFQGLCSDCWSQGPAPAAETVKSHKVEDCGCIEECPIHGGAGAAHRHRPGDEK